MGEKFWRSPVHQLGEDVAFKSGLSSWAVRWLRFSCSPLGGLTSVIHFMSTVGEEPFLHICLAVIEMKAKPRACKLTRVSVANLWLGETSSSLLLSSGGVFGQPFPQVRAVCVWHCAGPERQAFTSLGTRRPLCVTWLLPRGFSQFINEISTTLLDSLTSLRRL